jgi:hypothetical protein
VAAHGSKSRVTETGSAGMLELISANVASLPLDVAELLEPMDIGRFFEADIVIATGAPLLSARREIEVSVRRSHRMYSLTQKQVRKAYIPGLWEPATRDSTERDSRIREEGRDSQNRVSFCRPASACGLTVQG